MRNRYYAEREVCYLYVIVSRLCSRRQWMMSVVHLPSSVVHHPSSVTRRPSSRRPSSVAHHPSSFVRRPSPVVLCPSPVVPTVALGLALVLAVGTVVLAVAQPARVDAPVAVALVEAGRTRVVDCTQRTAAD